MGSTFVLLALTASLSQAQQPKYTEYGRVTERGGTRVAFWDNELKQAVGQAAIEFGRPSWKPEYVESLDEMTSGKIWRLGENFWTSLDTNVELTIGGVKVPIGYYYLAVKRSEDGADWALAFLDPIEARKNRLDPFEVATRPGALRVLFEAPLSFATLDAVRERLSCQLTEERFVIEWGTFSLSAPVSVSPR